jgi:pilus assembly protein Flp/PilA
MERVKKFWINFWKETEGQDLVEYALIVAAIALGMIAAVQGIGTALNSLYESISAALALTS